MMDAELKETLLFALNDAKISLDFCACLLRQAKFENKAIEASGAASIVGDWIKHIEAEAVD